MYYGDDDENKRSGKIMDDTAAYTIEILLNGRACRKVRAGYFGLSRERISSGSMWKCFERVAGRRVELVRGRDLEDAERELGAASERNPLDVRGYLLDAASVVGEEGL